MPSSSTVIHLLATRKDRLAGEVLFLLQPGEEGYNGADRMLDEGALELASGELVGAYALHVTTSQPLGTVWTRPGTLMAGSARLDVTVSGRGGHASAPQLALDPIQVVAEIITRPGACPPELDPATAPYNHSNLAVFDDSVLPDAAAYLAALAFARLDEIAARVRPDSELD
ncbi:MAG: hypothetical protein QOI70_354 [Microbacteriaceae bacterium]|jgi:metal-dependent amidase/aminoacylase/carboxypeptidase family protein|nr:hypothetical protein [Microbacteriaceae bacterium]